MHSRNAYRSLRLLAVIVPALVLSACVYRPVVMDNFSSASNYAELLAEIESNSKLAGALDKNVDTVMRPGEQVPGWRDSGIDMDVLLDTMPGGSAGNVFLGNRADDVFLTADRSFADFFGPQYTTHTVVGSDVAFAKVGADESVGLVRIGQGIWLETVGDRVKMGNAVCSGTGLTAARVQSRRPYDSLTKLEKSTMAAFVARRHMRMVARGCAA